MTTTSFLLKKGSEHKVKKKTYLRKLMFKGGEKIGPYIPKLFFPIQHVEPLAGLKGM
jgi:hypothetical protein